MLQIKLLNTIYKFLVFKKMNVIKKKLKCFKVIIS